MRVDFPAPLGPTIPTRLVKTISNDMEILGDANSYLDNESAQLTLKRLGFDRPGYVNVQFTILRIARVLLLTPIREPGGGKENLTLVAARV